jgi:hypothetical protein
MPLEDPEGGVSGGDSWSLAPASFRVPERRSRRTGGCLGKWCPRVHMGVVEHRVFKALVRCATCTAARDRRGYAGKGWRQQVARD